MTFDIKAHQERYKEFVEACENFLALDKENQVGLFTYHDLLNKAIDRVHNAVVQLKLKSYYDKS